MDLLSNETKALPKVTDASDPNFKHADGGNEIFLESHAANSLLKPRRKKRNPFALFAIFVGAGYMLLSSEQVEEESESSERWRETERRRELVE